MTSSKDTCSPGGSRITTPDPVPENDCGTTGSGSGSGSEADGKVFVGSAAVDVAVASSISGSSLRSSVVSSSVVATSPAGSASSSSARASSAPHPSSRPRTASVLAIRSDSNLRAYPSSARLPPFPGRRSAALISSEKSSDVIVFVWSQAVRTSLLVIPSRHGCTKAPNSMP